MANTKLGQFNAVTSLDETFHFALLKQNTDNYLALPSVVGKETSQWNSISNAVTAFATGGQANATQITKKWTIISICATRDDSLKMPVALAGNHYMVANVGAQSAQIYPATGETFNGQAPNVPVDIAVNSYMEMICNTNGNWGFRPIVGNYTSATTITAFAGGGQANATQLNNEYSKVTTVATAGDSVKLRAAKKGQRQVVVNADAADSMNVFPQSGDNFEGLAADAAVSLSFQTSMEAFCFVDGEWTLL